MMELPAHADGGPIGTGDCGQDTASPRSDLWCRMRVARLLVKTGSLGRLGIADRISAVVVLAAP